MYYAQIDGNGVCYAVTETSAEVVDTSMIRLGSFDLSLLGKLWTGSEWTDAPPND